MIGIRRFVVTGTGRSGTGYAAALFNAAGVSCGHEDWFGPIAALGEPGLKRRHPIKRFVWQVQETRRRRSVSVAGDASWMAAPRLPRFRGVVFHQLREPLAVISSLVGLRFFSDPAAHGRYHLFARRYFDVTGDDVCDSMRWWVEWNQRIDPYATLRYRLEDLDPGLLADLLDTLDHPDPTSAASRAFAVVAPGVNAKKDKKADVRALTWADLPSGPELERLCRAAEWYGYR